MRFVIVTGMSGSGKSSVMKILEDDGYFCVDNLPLSLLPTLIQLTEDSSEEIERVALGIDIRGGYRSLKEAAHVLDDLKSRGYTLEILFLEASTSVLVKRYKETRRNHPLAAGGRIETAIAEERQRLSFLKKQSDYIIDTSNLLIRDLKKEIQHIFVEDKDYSNFYITLLSFGFKYGIPADADLVFDVRFLPNPYYVDELKHQTGNDKPVYDYVMKSEDAGIFLKQLYDMLVFLIPRYIAEGKNQLVVAIGCTGGKHRSVTITNALYEKMKDLEYSIKAEHRDVDRDGQHKSSQVR